MAAESASLREFAVGWMLEEIAKDSGDHSERRCRRRELLRHFARQPVGLQNVSGERRELPFQVEVPSSPSFSGKANWLAWSLLVRVEAGDGSELIYKVPVWVRPPAPRGPLSP